MTEKNTTATMRSDLHRLKPLAFLRLQNWLSPAFPAGSYSYSHGVEWAVEAEYIRDRASLVDWLAADLRYGTGRNEAIFFSESWSGATNDDRLKLLKVAELAAAFRGTAEFALESSQQGLALRTTINQVWRDSLLDWLSEELANRNLRAAPAVILGLSSARQGISLAVALPAFLQSYVSNLVSAGVRLIPLGQTDGQAAIAALEDVVLALSSDAATQRQTILAPPLSSWTSPLWHMKFNIRGCFAHDPGHNERDSSAPRRNRWPRRIREDGPC